MRHLIILLVLVAILAVGVRTAVLGHDSYLHQVTVRNLQAAATQARQEAQIQLQARRNAAAVQKLQVSCQNGELAYNLLTATQKEHIVKPDCTL